jgi:hypothetical protein
LTHIPQLVREDLIQAVVQDHELILLLISYVQRLEGFPFHHLQAIGQIQHLKTHPTRRGSESAGTV